MRETAFAVPFALGAVVVVLDEKGRVTGVSFRSEGRIEAPFSSCLLARQIARYLRGRSPLPRVPLDLPARPEFFARVWREVGRIPYGATATYGTVAMALGRKGAARAVGQAMAANPVPLFVPCHRVVGADGLGGFSSGTDVKRWLLDMEARGCESPSAEGPVGPGRRRRNALRRDRAGSPHSPGRRGDG